MITRIEILSIWKSLVDWYVRKCRHWNRLSMIVKASKLEEEKQLLDKAYGLWGHVWHEHDLIVLFSHRLLKYIEEKGLNLHLHVNYRLKPNNFGMIPNFSNKLSRAIKELRNKLRVGKKWFPEIDLIIAKDDPPFLFCLEFKYYHYFPTTWDVVKDLERKVVVLEAMKKHEICKDAGILLLDDCICRRDRQLCEDIKEVLDKASKYMLILAHYVSYDELISTFNAVSKGEQVQE